MRRRRTAGAAFVALADIFVCALALVLILLLLSDPSRSRALQTPQSDLTVICLSVATTARSVGGARYRRVPAEVDAALLTPAGLSDILRHEDKTGALSLRLLVHLRPADSLCTIQTRDLVAALNDAFDHKRGGDRSFPFVLLDFAYLANAEAEADEEDTDQP